MTSTQPQQQQLEFTFDDGISVVEELRDAYAEMAKVPDRRRDQVFIKVEDAGITGLTVWELRELEMPTLHHGMASGALSVLHKAGRIVRTSAKRGGYSVYVTPENLAGRATIAQGRKAHACPNCGVAA